MKSNTILDDALREWLERNAFLCIVSQEGDEARGIYGYIERYDKDVIAMKTSVGLVLVDRRTVIKIRETKPKNE